MPACAKIIELADACGAPGRDMFGLPDISAEELNAVMAWHVRAWGRWVLAEARKDQLSDTRNIALIKPYQRVELDINEPLKLVPC